GRSRVHLGPIINEQQAARAERILKTSVDAGARVTAGGTREVRFFQPTILEGVLPGMPVYREETFGPVAAILTLRTDEEAIALASLSILILDPRNPAPVFDGVGGLQSLLSNPYSSPAAAPPAARRQIETWVLYSTSPPGQRCRVTRCPPRGEIRPPCHRIGGSVATSRAMSVSEPPVGFHRQESSAPRARQVAECPQATTRTAGITEPVWL
ncbi:MAG: aldehyde dehydrogenase family protein, partial [Verrucomicrobiales bacterium]|nr:aldehyde dehydrogenase family protein [Verrucomicrobiales bacterium]